MAGLLEHSPADIVRYTIIAHSLGTLHTGTGIPEDWTVFCDVEPDRPDRVITVYNTLGRKHKRTFPDSMTQEHYGILIRIRSNTPAEGYNKAAEIASVLDELVYQESIIIGSSVYCLHSFNRVGGILALPKDTVTPTRRIIHTFNGLTSIRQQTQGTGTVS